MGMFDSLVASFKCPYCLEEIGKSEGFYATIQTKAFFNALYVFELGDVVQDKTFLIKDGLYPAYAYCENCKKYIDFLLQIIDHKFLGVIQERRKEKRHD